MQIIYVPALQNLTYIKHFLVTNQYCLSRTGKYKVKTKYLLQNLRRVSTLVQFHVSHTE